MTRYQRGRPTLAMPPNSRQEEDSSVEGITTEPADASQSPTDPSIATNQNLQASEGENHGLNHTWENGTIGTHISSPQMQFDFPNQPDQTAGFSSNTSPADPKDQSAIYRASPWSSGLALPPQEQIEILVVAFFRHVHVYRANAFLHREETLVGLRDGSLAEAIVLALCAVGSRFIHPRTNDAETVALWASKAGQKIITSTPASRDNVSTALLLTIYMQQDSQFAQSHIWASIAMQQAVTLGLHRESHSDSRSFVDAERDRRLFFACYVLNRFISNGTPESVHCPASRIRLRLPCDGFHYRMDVSVETPFAILEEDDSHVPGWIFKNVGAMGFWVRLVGVRTMIKAYFQAVMENRESREASATQSQTQDRPQHMLEISDPAPPAPWEMASPFAVCLVKLASIRETLPPRLQLSPEHISRRQNDLSTLGQIIMFYLWWNQCHIELFSVVLPGYSHSFDRDLLSAAPEGWLNQTRQSCLRHARAITDILSLVEMQLGQQSFTIHDHTIAHSVYLSLRVQLEIRQIEPDDEDTRSRLKENLDMMLRFVERTSTYFRSVHLVVRSFPTLRMLRTRLLSERQKVIGDKRLPLIPFFTA